MGGIQRDMFSGYWKEVYAKFFEGSYLLIPMVNPHIDMTAYPIWLNYFTWLFGGWIICPFKSLCLP